MKEGIPCLLLMFLITLTIEAFLSIYLKCIHRSLPRNQLNLKPGQTKRRSGIWSKPPTPVPCTVTPGASDNEQ